MINAQHIIDCIAWVAWKTMLYYRPSVCIYLRIEWRLSHASIATPYNSSWSSALVVCNCHSDQLDKVLWSTQLLFQQMQQPKAKISFFAMARFRWLYSKDDLGSCKGANGGLLNICVLSRRLCMQLLLAVAATMSRCGKETYVYA